MNMDRLSTQWAVTATRISSKSSADVLLGEKAVRIPGELLSSFFLADPYEMFWLAKEDWETWPWVLPPEKRQNRLSEAESQAVVDAVNAFCKDKGCSIQFLTRELEARAFTLAEQIRNKQCSKRKAIRVLRKEFPNYLKHFYAAMIADALSGVSWYGHDDTRKTM